MKQEKFNSLMVAIVAIAAVFGFVSIVWAAFNQTLTISAYNAQIQPSKWDVHFANISSVTATGTASAGIVGSSPAVSGTPVIGTGTDGKPTTGISGFAATLMTPGDTVYFTVDMVNAGTYAAKISGITLPAVTVASMTSAADSTSQQTTDINNIKNYIHVSFTYNDANETALTTNDILAAAGDANGNDSKTVKMKVWLDAETPADKLPTAAITVPISATSITFGQV